MDQLTAYRILGLEPGCAQEEIKEAYAALSKQYHPEEQPEKFQEIHEAYVTLTRRKRRTNTQNEVPRDIEDVFGKENEPKKEFNFEHIEIEHGRQERQDYSFEEAMHKAKKEEQEKLHELTLQAIAEFHVLVSPKYKNSLKRFKTFFEDTKYSSIIKRAEFLRKLADILEQTKLKKSIYNYIIEFYRLRGLNPSDLTPEGLRLYQVLDEKAGMVRKEIHPGLKYGLPAGIIAGLRGGIKITARASDTVKTAVFIGAAIAICVWIYRKLHENHSSVFAQIIVAVLIQFSQFIVIMFELYGTVFGTYNDGNSLAAMIFLAAGLWLFILIIIGVVRLIKNIIGKFT